MDTPLQCPFSKGTRISQFSSWFPSSMCLERASGNNWHRFLQAGYPTFQPFNVAKTLTEKEIPDEI